MNVSCECRAIQFVTPAPAPTALYLCHCNECRRQSASAFGTTAVFPRFQIPFALLPKLGRWERETASGCAMTCWFCKTCGSRIMHERSGKEGVSIKGGCIEDLDWTKAVHIWVKEAVVPIPEGVVKFEEEPNDDP